MYLFLLLLLIHYLLPLHLLTDDPFDGMGEDDINFDTIDEWEPILETSSRTRYNSLALQPYNNDNTLQTFYEAKEVDSMGKLLLKYCSIYDNCFPNQFRIFTKHH